MYSLLAISIIAAGLNNALLHILAAKKTKYDAFLFNAAISFVWVIGLFCYNCGWRGSSDKTIIWGLVYGFALIGFIYFKSLAMTSGPIAITALIGCSSFILTTVFNAVFWKERVGVFGVSGIVLMIASVLLINFKPSASPKDEKTLKWRISCVFFFLFSGLIGIIFKFHQSADKVHTDEMMIFASAIATAGLAGIYLFKSIVKRGKKSGEAGCPKEKKSALTVAIALSCGAVSCLYNRLNIYNAGTLPSVLFFPVFNGGVVMLSFLCGVILFEEKPNKLQILGVILGIVAIIFFGLGE